MKYTVCNYIQFGDNCRLAQSLDNTLFAQNHLNQSSFKSRMSPLILRNHSYYRQAILCWLVSFVKLNSHRGVLPISGLSVWLSLVKQFNLIMCSVRMSHTLIKSSNLDNFTNISLPIIESWIKSLAIHLCPKISNQSDFITRTLPRHHSLIEAL